MDALTLSYINKEFSGHQAVDDASFTIPRQSIFGMLGPNGAGKTTLIRIITNILAADSGSISFYGEPLRAGHRNHIGYMPEERGMYKKMKVHEQLLYLARLRNMTKQEAEDGIAYWLDRFDMEKWADKKMEELSKGMQQKIQFVSTVMHKPAILILDEPFSGLDPVNSNLIREEIYRLRDAGTTIIFSTHRMEQVEEICEKIVLINKGQKMLEGSVHDVKEQFKENKFRIRYKGAMFPSHTPDFEILSTDNREAVIHLLNDITNNQLLQFLIENHIEVEAFNEILPTLNEVFIKQVTEQQSS